MIEQTNLFGDFFDFNEGEENGNERENSVRGVHKTGIPPEHITTDNGRLSEDVSSDGIHRTMGERGVRGVGGMDSRKTERVRQEMGETVQFGSKSSRSGRDTTAGIFSIDRADLDSNVFGGKVTRYNRNIEALKVLKKDRTGKATEEEKEILSWYTGWGGLTEVFDKDNVNWNDRYNELKKLLPEQEYREARKSILSAYYTHPDIAKVIWKGVQKLGFSGGNVLDPALGTGIFYGAKPNDLDVTYRGIEIDGVSEKISQLLYGDDSFKSIRSGYEDYRLEEGGYDLIISNVPFDDTTPIEKKSARTPGLDNKYALHDFYFLKSLHGLKSGGLTAFLTSRYTLDKENSTVREKIATEADFVGAIRLPNNAFKNIAGTSVVTDVVFLQKRSKDVEMSDLTKSFIGVSDIDIAGEKLKINNYYLEHPENIVGKQEITSSQFSSVSYTVGFENSFTEMLSSLDNIVEKYKPLKKVDREFVEEKKSIKIPMSYVLLKDKIYFSEYSKSGQFELTEYNPENKNRKYDILKSYLPIKKNLKDLLRFNNEGKTDLAEIERNNLNQSYDKFVKKFGPINKPANLVAIKEDTEYAKVTSIEEYDKTANKAKKESIFRELPRVSEKIEKVAKTPEEALLVSVNVRGKVDIDYMSELLGKSTNDVIEPLVEQNLIFPNPEIFLETRKIEYIASDDYLCGDTRKKYKTSLEAMEIDGRFEQNAEAIKKIIPQDLDMEHITIRMNHPVLKPKHLEDFLDHVTGTSGQFNAIFVEKRGEWIIDRSGWRSFNSEFGMEGFPAEKIVASVLNNKEPKIRKSESLSETKYMELSAILASKTQKIKDEFQNWVWNDPERAKEIVGDYNQKYNSYVKRDIVHPSIKLGREVIFPGSAFPYEAREHQANAVWRTIVNPNTMLAHSVGGGKTMEMIWSAMELKRLGLRNKPLFVTPNTMINQMVKSFQTAYPEANILIGDTPDVKGDKIAGFINKCAIGNYDAIIMKQSTFNRIPVSAEYESRFVSKLLDEYETALETYKSSNNGKTSTRSIENSIEKYRNKLKELDNRQNSVEGSFTFEDMQIDQLYIDEADMFKNLAYHSKMTNIKGMGKQDGSGRSYDLYMKIQQIQEKNGGVVFATGTPISNSLVEIYTMQRFLQPELLEERNIKSFDTWVNTWADISSQVELNNSGTGYKTVTRLSKLTNVPELIRDIEQCWDIKTGKDLEKMGMLVPGINLPYKNVVNIACPSTPILESYKKHLQKREENCSASTKEKDNVLCIIGDGQKAAIDMRLLNDGIPDNPYSKINVATELLLDEYKRYGKQKYVSIVFQDKPKSMSGFNSIKDLREKLINGGVKEEEIGDIRDCKNSDEKQRLFDKCNSGDIRIVFGSTELMGAGVNIQTKLKTLINLDAQWRPRDMEQRIGRIVRQGNGVVDINDKGDILTEKDGMGTVNIVNIVQKGSLDPGLWNLLETKSDIIEKILSTTDRSDERELEDGYYASVKELSIEDPLMKEKIVVDNEVKKLEIQKKGFQLEQATAKRIVYSFPRLEKDLKKRINNFQSDANKRTPLENIKGDKFSIEINGKKITDRKTAGKLIMDEFVRVKNTPALGAGTYKSRIGSYAGLPLNVMAMKFGGGFSETLSVEGNFVYRTEVDKTKKNPVELIKSLTREIYTKLDKKIEKENEKLDALVSKYEQSVKKIEGKFPFSEKLDELRKRSYVLTESIGQNQKKDVAEKNPIPWERIEIRGLDTENMLSKDDVEFYIDDIMKDFKLPTDWEYPTRIPVPYSNKEKTIDNNPGKISNTKKENLAVANDVENSDVMWRSGFSKKYNCEFSVLGTKSDKINAIYVLPDRDKYIAILPDSKSKGGKKILETSSDKNYIKSFAESFYKRNIKGKDVSKNKGMDV